MIRNLLLIISLIALGAYGISIIPNLDARMQIAITISVVSIIALAIIYPKVEFDFKFILIIICGYLLFGKRFAYLSPFEPIFIGEICLAISFIMAASRVFSKGLWGKLFDTSVHVAIWLLLIYGGIHLYLDFSRYNLLALKDAATIYYGLFFIIAYILFQKKKNRDIFEKSIPIMIGIGLWVACISFLARLGMPVLTSSKDAYIGASTAFFIICFLQLVKSKSLIWAFLLIIFSISLVIVGKMSEVLAIIVVISVLVLWAKRIELSFLVLICTCLLILVLVTLEAMSSELMQHIKNQFYSIDLTNIDSANFVSSTSGWRLAWWGEVWKKTMLVNPWWGQGFGADLTNEFAIRYWGTQSDKVGNSNVLFGAARYPHNIVFTIIGRLGLVGLILFILYFITVINYVYKFIRLYCCGSLRTLNLVNIAIVVFILAGLANSFVQCTYEAPYSAIPHWVMLAYLVIKVKSPTEP